MEHDERLAILEGLPKVDLHRHLEGSIRLPTLQELGRKNGINLPTESLQALAPFVTWSEGEPRSLAHFLSKFHAGWYKSYADIERVTQEVVEDAFSEGIVHLELRFSPEHLTRESHLELQGVMQAVAEAGRATAAELGLGLKFLVTFARERYAHDFWKRIVDLAAGWLDLGFAGVDLAGDEFQHPNHEFVKLFGRVRDIGTLGISIHAGEGTSATQVSTAVTDLGAQRIGHGLKAVEDPTVVTLLAARGVALEMCPISNFQTGCVDNLSQHPLPALDKAGVRVTLNADDPTIHGTTLNDEYDVALASWGYTLDDLLRLERNAVAGAFLSEEERAALGDRVERGYQESRGQGLA